jgi:hypothetical protein
VAVLHFPAYGIIQGFPARKPAAFPSSGLGR